MSVTFPHTSPLTNSSAKVLLHTTAGDIDIELWGKECPLATRNFLQHCLDGYYDNTIFHRIVPGFIIQGGDPTGTGSGGESIYDGEPFADEFSNRLRFNRRGLLGSANSGKDDNGSQFFFTLAEAKELNGKNTLFGKVVGDTVYNLVKMGEREVEGERFLYPVKITGAEILINPFPDMVKRVTKVEPEKKEEEKKPAKKPAGKKKGGKQLLSFGDEEGDGDVQMPVKKKVKYDTRLVADLPEAKSALASKLEKKRSPSPIKEKTPPPPKPATQAASKPAAKAAPKRSSKSPSTSPEPEDPRKKALEETHAKIESIKQSLRRTGPAADAPPPEPAQPKKQTAKSLIYSMLPPTSEKGRRKKLKRSKEAVDDDTWEAAMKFQSRLSEAKSAAPKEDERRKSIADDETSGNKEGGEGKDAGDEEEQFCDLHFVPNCLSCKKWDEENAREDSPEPGAGGSAWMSHKLTFEKDRLGKDLEWKRKNEEELLVIDPREKQKEIMSERKGKGGGRSSQFRPGERGQGGGREWDRDRRR